MTCYNTIKGWFFTSPIREVSGISQNGDSGENALRKVYVCTYAFLTIQVVLGRCLTCQR